MTTPTHGGGPPAGGHGHASLAELEGWAKRNQKGLLVGGVGLVVLLGLRAKSKKSTAATATGATTTGSAQGYLGGGTSGSGGSGYDSSALDVYNAVQGQMGTLADSIARLQGTQSTTAAADPTGTAAAAVDTAAAPVTGADLGPAAAASAASTVQFGKARPAGWVKSKFGRYQGNVWLNGPAPKPKQANTHHAPAKHPTLGHPAGKPTKAKPSPHKVPPRVPFPKPAAHKNPVRKPPLRSRVTLKPRPKPVATAPTPHPVAHPVAPVPRRGVIPPKRKPPPKPKPTRKAV